MPLVIPPAPPQSIEPMRQTIPSLAFRPSLLRVAPRLSAAITASAGRGSLSPSLSYRVYVLGLSDIVAPGKGLSAASLAAWRHTLSSEGETVTADVSVDRAGTNFKFASISANPSAPDVARQVQTLSADSTIAATYEVALLQVPALGVRALWLRDTAGRAPDVVVPVAPVRSELTAGRRYSADEFLGALRPLAATALADDDPRKGA
jgi:hypothetical protein